MSNEKVNSFFQPGYRPEPAKKKQIIAINTHTHERKIDMGCREYMYHSLVAPGKYTTEIRTSSKNSSTSGKGFIDWHGKWRSGSSNKQQRTVRRETESSYGTYNDRDYTNGNENAAFNCLDDGDHILDIGALDKEYEQMNSTANSTELEAKATTAAFDVRKYISTAAASSSSSTSHRGAIEANSKSIATSSIINVHALAKASSGSAENNPASTMMTDLGEVSVDSFYCSLFAVGLDLDIESMPAKRYDAHPHEEGGLKIVPSRFLHEEQYVSIFEPLLLREVRAALRTYVESDGRSSALSRLKDGLEGRAPANGGYNDGGNKQDRRNGRGGRNAMQLIGARCVAVEPRRPYTTKTISANKIIIEPSGLSTEKLLEIECVFHLANIHTDNTPRGVSSSSSSSTAASAASRVDEQRWTQGQRPSGSTSDPRSGTYSTASYNKHMDKSRTSSNNSSNNSSSSNYRVIKEKRRSSGFMDLQKDDLVALFAYDALTHPPYLQLLQAEGTQAVAEGEGRVSLQRLLQTPHALAVVAHAAGGEGGSGGGVANASTLTSQQQQQQQQYGRDRADLKYSIGLIVLDSNHRISASALKRKRHETDIDKGLRSYPLAYDRTHGHVDAGDNSFVPLQGQNNKDVNSIRKKKNNFALSYHVDSVFVVVPLMSISTFTREWCALHSVRSHTLIPLAPYLLKAAPVISANRLAAINADLIGALKAYRSMYALCSSSSSGSNRVNIRSSAFTHASYDVDIMTRYAERMSTTVSEIEKLLTSLYTVEIDGSVLKKTRIVDTINTCKGSGAVGEGTGEISHECSELASSLLKKWKQQVKDDNRCSTLRALTGGNVLEPPSYPTSFSPAYTVPNPDRNSIPRPGCVPNNLWEALGGTYNRSQLFAIQHVVCGRTELQDLQVSLVQGPPGTGKTKTILGMISALLHSTEAAPASSSTSSGVATRLVDPNPMSSDALPPTVLSASLCISRNRPIFGRILICAPSNAAVDELLCRLLADGVIGADGQTRSPRLLRLGTPLAGAKAEIERLELEQQTEAIVMRSLQRETLHQAWKLLDAAVDELKTLEAAGVSGSRGSLGNTGRDSVSREQQLRGDGGRMALSEGRADTYTHTHTQAERLQRARAKLALLRLRKAEAQAAVERLRRETRRDLLNEAEIVAGTLSSCGKQIFLDHIKMDNVRFEVAIIDEAGQASEPSTLIPLRYGCRTLVLVGDPRQLPATVLCPSAAAAGLGMSLFERLEGAGHPVLMLREQYRMHPDISLFPARRFYQGRLTDAPAVSTRNSAASHLLFGDPSGRDAVKVKLSYAPLVKESEYNNNNNNNNSSSRASSITLRRANFFDVSSSQFIDCAEEATGTSWLNAGEAKVVVEILRAIASHICCATATARTTKEGKGRVHGGDTPVSVAVISPYKAQVNLLKQLLRSSIPTSNRASADRDITKNVEDRGERAAVGKIPSSISSSLIDSSAVAIQEFLETVEVNTVDGFQGREKDIVVFSAVRSSRRPRGQQGIGFVADERRVNVTVTRARECLVIVGDATALRQDDTWRDLIHSLRERGFYSNI